MLDYIGKSLWEKGSPTSGLENSGLGAEYARKEFKDDGRIWRSGRV